MTQCCFVCNSRTSNSLRNAISLFGEHNTFTSGNKVAEVLSEILGKPVQEDKVHANILCKKCHKSCAEYDALHVRLKAIKTELLDQFKVSLVVHNLNYDNYEKSVVNSKPKMIGNKLVLPASKLQPIPPDLLLKVGKLAPFAKSNMIFPQSKPTMASTLNLKVTVGSSVLTQTIKTTTSKPTDKPTDTNTTFTTITSPLRDIDSVITTQSNSTQKNSILNFNVNTLPKDFLAGAVMVKNEKVDEESKVDKNNEDSMEIDEDCLSVVPVTTTGGGNLVLQVNGLQTKSDRAPEVNEYLNVDMPSLDDVEEINDAKKYILGKLEILNEGDEDDDDEDDDGHTIVVDSENGSILQMVSGQKFIYEGGEISLVMPDKDQQDDVDDADSQDNGDSQDSNDESQIELQVSGDEDIANAIIAAAQEQGGAFIKVESGEMYRVKSVSSTTPSDATDATDTNNATNATADAADMSLQIVAQEENLFKCLLCEKSEQADSSPCMTDADSMMQHLKTVHDARLYICQFCGAVMRRRTDYTTHIAEHAQKLKPSGGRTSGHRCTTCNKSFSSRTLLQEHHNVHSGARPYVCNVCSKTFASKYTHQAHLKTHAVRPRPFKCSQCGKSFLTQQNLNQHEKTHSGVKDFVCNICNKAFSTQHNLEVHGVVHSGNKAFVCSACGKAFARRAELRDHMRTHTGERPFSCDICGASFAQRSNLHSHRRATHLDDKRYHCTQCPKRFKRRRLLEYHVKASHTGERPLKCEFCHWSFVYPEHYKKHIRIHNGERPYDCEICGKSFNSRDNRNKHRFVHSDKKPYECVACGAGYMRKQLLYNHMNTSGHMAESIVVNQPRVVKVTEDGTEVPSNDQNDAESNDKYDAIFKPIGVDGDKTLESNVEVNLDGAKFFITDDKKIILHDTDKTTLNLIQDSDDPTLLTIHNITERSDGTILADQLGEQADLVNSEIVTNDENGGVVRLIPVKLADGNNGWVAINR